MDALSQYYLWRGVSLIIFGGLFLLWESNPVTQKRIGVHGAIIMLIATGLIIYYLEYKSGYNPKALYNGTLA